LSHQKPNRVYLWNSNVDNPTPPPDPNANQYTPKPEEIVFECAPEAANLVTSEVAGKAKIHAPVIDFDIPIMAVPSSQMGHWHLYIDGECSDEMHFEILDTLAKAGFVEEGYAKASRTKGYSAVRPPGVKKPNADESVATLRMAHAMTLSEVFLLECKLQDALKRIEELEAENQKLTSALDSAQAHSWT
jgi:hypothetical protein